MGATGLLIAPSDTGAKAPLRPPFPAGHAHPEITNAIREQAGKLLHVSNLYYTDSQVTPRTRARHRTEFVEAASSG